MKNKALFKTNLIYFITIATFVAVRILSSVGIFDGLSSEVASNVFTLIIQLGVMFVLPIGLSLLFFKKGVKNTFKDIGFKRVSSNTVVTALLIGFLAFFLNLAVSTVFNGIISFFGYNPTGSGSGSGYSTFLEFITGILFVAVLPGIFEEITHRGVLLRGYAKEIGYKRAIVYSALLFGLMHLNISQVFYAIVMGGLIGTVATVSGSIFPAMLVHFMNNAINVYLVYAASSGLPGGNFYDYVNNILQASNPLIIFMTTFVFLGLLVIGIFVLILKLYKENTVKNLQNIQEKVERTLDSQIFTDEKAPEAAEIAAVNMVLSEKLKPLLPDFSQIKSPVDLLIPASEADKYQPTLLENLFFYASIFLGVTITIFTFIWGVV
ncbi:MAG: lysostaphin resistance A-like protein [Spirochaetales bacterium]